MVMPEDLSDKAEVEGDSEVENGKTLKFKVTPDEGYEVEVTANGNVLEGHKGMLGLADYYNYRVADVKEDLDIEINVTGEETEGFFYEETIDGVTVTLSAEEGVLPEGTTAEIEEVELGAEDGISEEELSKYNTIYAFDIKLYDKDGELLSDDWSENGSVKVEFSGEKIKEQAEKSETADIIHIDRESDKVEIEEHKAEAEIVYEAEHFSIFAVAYADEAAGNVIYVSAEGNDETGTGNKDNPYATLAGAIEPLNNSDDTDYTIYVMSNIEATSSARFWGKNITITSYGDETYTITRQDEFSPTIDQARGGYNGAMIEVNGSLILTDIILDDNGQHKGDYFVQAESDGDGNTNIEGDYIPNNQVVQDAIVSSYDGAGDITLGDGAILKNFGGMSAVRVGGSEGSLRMLRGSKIVDDNINDRSKYADNTDYGPAGAVWMQGGSFIMEEGAFIGGTDEKPMIGRAIYEDGGSIIINGTIDNVKADPDMWQGRTGIAIHVRNEAKAVLGGTGVISNITADKSDNAHAVSTYSSDFEAINGSEIINCKDVMIAYADDTNKGYRHNLILNGLISGNETKDSLFRSFYGLITLGPTGVIDNNIANGAGGLMYTHNGSHYIIQGHITHNTANEGMMYLANQSGGQTEVTIEGGAVISKNTGLGIRVNNGSHVTMNGGEISYNTGAGVEVTGKNENNGRHKGVSFIFNNGKIIGNGEYGIIYDIRNVGSEANLDITGGEISGNKGEAQILIEGAGAGAEDNYDNIYLNEGVLEKDPNFKVDGFGTITLDEDYPIIEIGKAKSDTVKGIKDILQSEYKKWTTLGNSALWFKPTEEDIHFSVTRPSGANYGVYFGYIPIKTDGTPAENATLSLVPAIGGNELDITLNLTSGESYAGMLIESDKYMIYPVDTTIYTGGSDDGGEYEDGFPRDEFEGIPEGAQFIVNGEPWTGEGYPFHIVYKDAEGKTIGNDQNEGIYTAEIVHNGEIAISVGQGQPTGVEFETGKLTIRYISNKSDAIQDKLTTDLFESNADAAAAIADSEKAVAVVNENTSFAVNGDAGREIASENTDGIALLDDEILSGDSFENGVSREDKLIDKAVKELGLTAEQKNNLKYDFHYLDLVDTNNGNAWVSSSEGTDIFMPYPDEAKDNSKFTLLHFEDLHREYGFEGEEEIDTAIDNCDVSQVDIVPIEGGIKFHIAESGFSPFVLLWMDETPVKPENPDDNDDGHHSSGGGSSSGGSYTVGINGNWVHVDPADINAPLSTAVPEGATPVTNPEWHQWKFILNNGTMIFNQWAYIRNPYAVNGQPSEGWFSFDENGIMNYGWYLDVNTGNWYYLHRESDGMLGTMETGWHYDGQDGRWYYLDPDGGEMLLGWQQIGGSWYYFNPMAPAVTWNYDEATGGWTYNGSDSRPYGSMYINETTPDGYTVDENGAWRN